jgi:Leu/Phe-tRNA-protein transferase
MKSPRGPPTQNTETCQHNNKSNRQQQRLATSKQQAASSKQQRQLTVGGIINKQREIVGIPAFSFRLHRQNLTRHNQQSQHTVLPRTRRNNSDSDNNNNNSRKQSTPLFTAVSRTLNKLYISVLHSPRMPPNVNNSPSLSESEDTIHHYIPHYLRSHVMPYHQDFCVTPHFHPVLLAQLMAEGFLPIATNEGRHSVVLPKLHQRRCVIGLPDNLHTRKSTRKKARAFSMTINKAFDAVMEGCRNQHGSNCWLVKPLVEAFRELNEQTIYASVDVVNDKQASERRGRLDEYTNDSSEETMMDVMSIPVRLYSIEVWDADELVAGELGYTVGSVYTSLTGFTSVDSAGSVQLAALGQLLIQSGFTLWDLGMEMEYKHGLGATLWPRSMFVDYLHQVRSLRSPPELPLLGSSSSLSARNCRDIIENVDASAAMEVDMNVKQKAKCGKDSSNSNKHSSTINIANSNNNNNNNNNDAQKRKAAHAVVSGEKSAEHSESKSGKKNARKALRGAM